MALAGTGFSPEKLDDSIFASDNDVDASNMFLTAAKEIIEHMNSGDCLPNGMALPGIVLPLEEEDKDDFDLGASASQANVSVSSTGSTKARRLICEQGSQSKEQLPIGNG